MKEEQFQFRYITFESADELEVPDLTLLRIADQASLQAYAPYSRFCVGAAAQLNNGEIVTGNNQENASFPAGICAERVLLSTLASLYPDMPVLTIAITYRNLNGESNHPVSPCGICRQSLLEYETRTYQPIRLILSGQSGKVFLVPESRSLLPLSFSGNDLH